MKHIALLLALLPVTTLGATLNAPSEVLYTEASVAGETLDQFAGRIAPKARQTTVELNSEICGSFQKNGEAYRITFNTNHSVWGCNIDFIHEGDWKATRLTMHTHTKDGLNGFSKTDNELKLQGYVVSLYTVTKRVGNREGTLRVSNR